MHKVKNRVKYKFNIWINKLVSIFIIITSISFYLPVASFAEDSDSNSDGNKKSPALVPVAADSIISKYIDSGFNGNSEGGSNKGSSKIITDNKDRGNGWNSVTKIKYANGVERTYRNYKQFNNGNNDYWNYPYWGSNIWNAGCGPTSIAIILSGYGYDYNPKEVVQKMSKIGIKSSSYSNLITTLKSFKIDAELKSWTSNSEKEIKENFNAGRPMIVGVTNHFITYLGLDKDGKLIISDPGKNDGQDAYYGATISELKSRYGSHQYILIKSDGNATSNTSSSSKSSDNKSDSNKSSSSSSNKSSNGGAGKVISTSNYNSKGGYSGVYESRTTGKRFKEYKQNSQWAISKFPNVAWKQECGKISALTIGSGYTDKATYEDLYNNILGKGSKNSTVHGIIDTYTKTNADFQSMVSIDKLKKALSDGCVASIHVSRYPNTPTHYMSILDINNDNTKIYLSDPWGGTSYTGWKDISIVNSLGTHEICFVSSDGKVVDYSGDGDSSDTSEGSSESSIDMSKNIVDNGHGGYKINIKLNKEIDDMLAKLKKTDFKMESYLSSKNQKEYLKNMIKAAIVTQYPDLRSAKEIADDEEVPNNETQGCIKVKRYADNETRAFAGNSLSNPVDHNDKDKGMYLAYKPYEDFSKMISDGDKNALNYFSMDSSNNIVVAGWETMEVTVNGPVQTNAGEVGEAPSSYKEEYQPANEPYTKLTEQTVDYLNQVSNYTMPFSLMWSLLIYGHDEDFINDLAKLVIDTEIIIGSYDATNIRETNHEYTYSKVGQAKSTAYVSNGTGNSPHESNSVDLKTVTVEYKFKVTETDILKTDTPSLNIKYADTWTAVYNKDYKVKTETKNADKQTNKPKDETNGTDYYQKEGSTYSGDRKPDDNSLMEKIDKNIDEEKDRIIDDQISKIKDSVEERNKNLDYKYQAVSKKIDEHFSNSDPGFIKFLQIKDVQSHIINYITDQSSREIISNTFNTQNDLIVKYARQLQVNDNYTYEDIINNAVNGILILVSDKELYNEVTKNGQNTSKAITYDIKITSVQITEEKKKTNQEETITEKNTNAKVEEVATKGGNVRFKVDKNADENSFVKLLAYSKSAKGNLQIIDSWFFDSLEDTEAIADMEDLLKYLFQCVYKTDYGIKKEDIEKLKDLFDPEKNMTKVSTSRTVLKGGNIQEKVWNYYISKGFSDEATAGIMGNFQQESSFNPKSESSAAAGICQFEKNTGEFANMKKYAESKGKDWTDLQCQLDYLMKLLPGAFKTYTGRSPYYYGTGEWCWWPEKMSLNDFKKLNDPEKAAEIFCRVYERASLPMIQNRKDYARGYYNKYHK